MSLFILLVFSALGRRDLLRSWLDLVLFLGLGDSLGLVFNTSGLIGLGQLGSGGSSWGGSVGSVSGRGMSGWGVGGLAREIISWAVTKLLS